MPEKAPQTKKKHNRARDFVFAQYVPFLVNRLAIALLNYSTPDMERRGLTIPKYRILMVLRERKLCNFKQVAEMTRIEPPTLSRLLNLLEEAKLVRRSKSVLDTRSVLISLSPTGKAAADKMIPFSESVEEMALEGISAEDAETLRRLLTQTYENVLRQGRGPGHRQRARSPLRIV